MLSPTLPDENLFTFGCGTLRAAPRIKIPDSMHLVKVATFNKDARLSVGYGGDDADSFRVGARSFYLPMLVMRHVECWVLQPPHTAMAVRVQEVDVLSMSMSFRFLAYLNDVVLYMPALHVVKTLGFDSLLLQFENGMCAPVSMLWNPHTLEENNDTRLRKLAQCHANAGTILSHEQALALNTQHYRKLQEYVQYYTSIGLLLPQEEALALMTEHNIRRWMSMFRR